MSFKDWFSKPLFTADVHVNNYVPEAPLPVVEEIRHDEFPLIFKFLSEEYPGWEIYRGEIYVPIGGSFSSYAYSISREELRRAAALPIEKIPTLTRYSNFSQVMVDFFMWRLKEGV